MSRFVLAFGDENLWTLKIVNLTDCHILLQIEPIIDHVYSMEELPAAYSLLEARQHVGKVVIRISSDQSRTTPPSGDDNTWQRVANRRWACTDRLSDGSFFCTNSNRSLLDKNTTMHIHIKIMTFCSANTFYSSSDEKVGESGETITSRR